MAHIAFIPARKGSKGFPHKNRRFFGNTADFIDSVDWFSRRIVSTDDPEVVRMAGERGYEILDRPAELAGDAVSIKAVFEHALDKAGVAPDDVLWLFYLPVLYKDRDHFEQCREVMEQGSADSLCGFIPARSHPYSCWRLDEEQGLSQYIENNVFRRQDMPPAWTHHHYLCCFRAFELPALNQELINARTHPRLLDHKTADSLIEVDTPEDWERWRAFQAGRD